MCLQDRQSFGLEVRSGLYLLNLELQVRGLITASSHQPDDGSFAPTGLVFKSLNALLSGRWILIGWRKKEEAQIPRSWCTRAGQWQVNIVSVKLAL